MNDVGHKEEEKTSRLGTRKWLLVEFQVGSGGPQKGPRASSFPGRRWDKSPTLHVSEGVVS